MRPVAWSATAGGLAAATHPFAETPGKRQPQQQWRSPAVRGASLARYEAAGATPQEHVAAIRKEKFGLEGGDLQADTPIIRDLHRSVKLLSEGLYSADIHFVMELLQNAEDSQYAAGVVPKITFEMKEKDATGTLHSDGMLIVRSDEVGFSPKDVEAICSVGGSTKKRSQMQIGEKGIGFKSVFVVSKRPHIASRGYQFHFDEDPDLECGLGYIVPTWIRKFPASTDENTTFLLPLKEGKKELVMKELLQVQPELLLFLRKVRHIEVEQNGEVRALTKVAKNKLIELSSEGGSEDDIVHYWKKEKTVAVPDTIEEENRRGVNETTISLAFPLRGKQLAGQPNLYAFLPLEMRTPFSFILNADFIVSAARERVMGDRRWNKWLFFIVMPEVFLEAFLDMLSERPDDHPFAAFRYIPTGEWQDFKKTKTNIIEKLKQNEVIPIWREHDDLPGKQVLVKPSKAIYFPEEFAPVFEVMSKAKKLPRRFVPGDVRFQSKQIVHPDVAALHSSTLDELEVKKFSKVDLEQLMKDVKWVHGLEDEMLVTLFLQICEHCPKTKVFFQNDIVPLEQGRWGCCEDSTRAGILYVADPKAVPVLQGCLDQMPGAPVHIPTFRGSVYTGLVNSGLAQKRIRRFWQCPMCSKQFFAWDTDQGLLLHLVKTRHAESRGGKSRFMQTASIVPEWLDTLGLKPLSAVRWCTRVSGVLRDRADNRGARFGQILVHWVHAIWKLRCGGIDFTNEELAILSRQLLWVTTSGGLVTESTKVLLPARAAEWPKIFDSDAMVEQGSVLSPLYMEEFLDDDVAGQRSFQRFLVDLGVKDIPEWRPPVTETDCRLPPLAELTEEVVPQLLGWLEKLAGIDDIWQRPDGTDTKFARDLKDKTWVPTTQGPQRPLDVLVDSQQLREMMGETLPFIATRVSQQLTKRLGFRTAPSLSAIVESLVQLKDGDDVAFEAEARKIYGVVAQFDAAAIGAPAEELQDAFHKHKLVLVHGRWYSPRECVWRADERIFKGDFGVLENLYGELRGFFIMLGVPSQPSPSDYLRKWRGICDEGSQPKDEQVWLIWRGIMVGPDWDSRGLAAAEDLLQTGVSQDWLLLPTAALQLRSPKEVVIADDAAWNVFFDQQEASSFAFAWPGAGPDVRELPEDPVLVDPLASLQEVFERVGASRCPSALRIKENLSQPEKPLVGKHQFLRIMLVRAIDVWLRAKMMDFLDPEALQSLISTCEFSVPNLSATYTLSSKTGTKLAEVTSPLTFVWRVEEGKLLVKQCPDGTSHMEFKGSVANDFSATLAQRLIPDGVQQHSQGLRRIKAMRTEVSRFVCANLFMPEPAILSALRQDPETYALLPKDRLDAEAFQPEERLPPMGEAGPPEEISSSMPSKIHSPMDSSQEGFQDEERPAFVADVYSPSGMSRSEGRFARFDTARSTTSDGQDIMELDEDGDGASFVPNVDRYSNPSTVGLDREFGVSESSGRAPMHSASDFPSTSRVPHREGSTPVQQTFYLPPRKSGPIIEDSIPADAEFAARYAVSARRGAEISEVQARETIAEVNALLEKMKPLNEHEATSKVLPKRKKGKKGRQQWVGRSLPQVYRAVEINPQNLDRSSVQRVDALLTLAMLPPGLGKVDNRQLAWIGDAILGSFVSELLYDKASAASAGQLSAWRSHLVRLEACAVYLKTLGLSEHIITVADLPQGPSASNAEISERVQAEVFEALLGAVYFAAGRPKVRSLLQRCMAKV